MKLESIYLSRGYGKSGISGTIKYSGTYGEVSVNISDEKAGPILAAIAESLVASSRELADRLTGEIVSHANALPAPAKTEVVTDVETTTDATDSQEF